MKSIHIGITGGEGFLGSHIKNALEKKGGFFIDSFDSSKGNLLDINNKKLINFVKNKDIIIHAAAVMRANNYSLISGNVVATYKLLEAIKIANSKAKVIFISSSAVETASTVYGKSKELAELMCEEFSKIMKNQVTIFRLTNIFGEGSRPFYNMVTATFCYQIVHGEKLKINKKGPPITLIYVGDVVKAILQEISKKRKNHFFFKRIYSKNVITLENLVKTLTSFKNLKKPIKLKNKFERDLYKTYNSFIPNKK